MDPRDMFIMDIHRKSQLEDIEFQVNRAQRILKDLLEFVRDEKDLEEQKYQLEGLQDVINSVVVNLAYAKRDHNVYGFIAWAFPQIHNCILRLVPLEESLLN